jgi:hypothetical protein
MLSAFITKAVIAQSLDESAKDARTAHVRVHHDADHQSVIQIPIVR